MKFYDDLAKPDSDLVQEALLSGCPVCNAQPGNYCQTVVTGDPLHEAYGDYVHMIRADKLPYTTAEGKLRRPKKPKYPKASTEHIGMRAGGPNG